MGISEFLGNQTDETKNVFKTLDALIRKSDRDITTEVGSIIRIKEAIVYKQDNVFKYGLTVTKNYYSFHSMVMYVYPNILELFRKASKDIKFQKGCFNFKTLESINLSEFEELLRVSALQDFTPVIRHYKNKKK